MPIYRVTSIIHRFSASQRDRLAVALTEIHCRVMGTPTYLVQVLFDEIPPCNCYMGGRALQFDSVTVHGLIRLGRSEERKVRLIAELMHAVAAIGETDKASVHVFITDVPAHQMAEWGRILPEPGDEAAWEHGIPADVQERIRIVTS